MTEQQSAPGRLLPLVASIGVLAVVNVATALLLPGGFYLPVNVLTGALLVWWATLTGSTSASLGLARESLARGIRLGLAAAAIGVLVIGIGAVVPWTRTMFEDSRAAGVGALGLAYQALVRIPIGTAVFEEVAFRGVLVDQGRRLLGHTGGTALSALLFGLWHILPARAVASGNEAAGGLSDGLVIAGAVVSTALAGWVFTTLRDRSDSLAAPVILHGAINMSAFLAAWMVLA